MPRLLLVDDNPSIHRIAESLLAPTDVELVCVDSAAEALDRIAHGERFDVALVDTAMPGMDGWTLLGRLRAMDETARMPIALMAGVLDPVDPAKLAKAPIQGFLKKPIELRELGDRVKALLVTPVVASPSPFSTMPATPSKDLVRRAEAVLPEFRPEPEDLPAEVAAAGSLDLDLPMPEPEDDLLVLTQEDLWPEEKVESLPEAALPPPGPSEVHLELEELDLDSLQELTSEPEAQGEPMLPQGQEPFLPDDDPLVTLSGLEDLDLLTAEFEAPAALPEPTSLPAAVFEPGDFLADLPTGEVQAGTPGIAVITGPVAALPDAEAPDSILSALEPFRAPEFPSAEVEEPVPSTPAWELPSVAPAVIGQGSAAPGQVIPAFEVSPESHEAVSESIAAAPGSFDAAPLPSQAQALLQALLAEPVLMDALVKALVARMGDQVLREIAWEVMPDLAERLHQ